MKIYLSVSMLFFCSMLASQEATTDPVPYAEIPEAPETFTPGTVVSRMIDGLGFRYYWATEGLKENDYNYKPSEDGRTIGETIEHVYGLSNVILNCAKIQPNGGGDLPEGLTIDDKRKAALKNFKMASELFKATEDLAAHKVIYKRNGNTSAFPLWNFINGPAEDALWHAGQLVVMRRSAGNPIRSGVNVFSGKLNK